MTQTNIYSSESSFRKYLSRTFSIVAMGVGISAVIAFISSLFVPQFLYSHPNMVLIATLVLAFGEIGVAIFFSTKLNSMSKQTAWFCYILYSVLTGLSLSTIISLYTTASVTLAFVATAILFACMSIIGHTSRVDFTKVYSLFAPAIIAGIIITILNTLFFKQPWISLVICYVGIILFLCIVAADTKKLSNYYFHGFNDGELSEKYMIMGSFQLYLDFINLFIRIISILGKNKDSRR